MTSKSKTSPNQNTFCLNGPKWNASFSTTFRLIFCWFWQEGGLINTSLEESKSQFSEGSDPSVSLASESAPGDSGQCSMRARDSVSWRAPPASFSGWDVGLGFLRKGRGATLIWVTVMFMTAIHCKIWLPIRSAEMQWPWFSHKFLLIDQLRKAIVTTCCWMNHPSPKHNTVHHSLMPFSSVNKWMIFISTSQRFGFVIYKTCPLL